MQGWGSAVRLGVTDSWRKCQRKCNYSLNARMLWNNVTMTQKHLHTPECSSDAVPCLERSETQHKKPIEHQQHL